MYFNVNLTRSHRNREPISLHAPSGQAQAPISPPTLGRAATSARTGAATGTPICTSTPRPWRAAQAPG